MLTMPSLCNRLRDPNSAPHHLVLIGPVQAPIVHLSATIQRAAGSSSAPTRMLFEGGPIQAKYPSPWKLSCDSLWVTRDPQPNSHIGG